ncbi:MAG: hypothetical protein AAFO81_12300 [Pseudomonadota bacterium]
MKNLLLIAAAACAVSIAAPATADDDLWIAARAGTQGIGLEGTWRPVPYLDLRLGFGTYDYDTTRTEAGIDYDVGVDIQTVYATLNARLPLSPFRVSVGLVNNGNEGALLGNDTGTYNIGGTTFDASDVGNLRGSVSWDDIAPYAGIGFDFRVADTFGLHFDAGAMYQGDATLQLSADGPLAGNQILIDAIEAERAELEEDLEDLKWWPVLAVSFSVNF